MFVIPDGIIVVFSIMTPTEPTIDEVEALEAGIMSALVGLTIDGAAVDADDVTLSVLAERMYKLYV